MIAAKMSLRCWRMSLELVASHSMIERMSETVMTPCAQAAGVSSGDIMRVLSAHHSESSTQGGCMSLC